MYSRPARLALTCISAAANALTAGGIFTFPLVSPELSARLRLTQPQLTSIVLAGMIGQYPCAAIVGRVIDTVGPWACSLASALLFSLGFGLFSAQISNAATPTPSSTSPSSSFHLLVAYFFLAGLGTVSSYFSSLFSASKNFPRYSGIASGTTMALFGLSPLVLSLFASSFFHSPEFGVDAARYTKFLAILTGITHVAGAITMTIEPSLQDPTGTTASATASDSEERETEITPLISSKSGEPHGDRFSDLLRDSHFWFLGLVTLLTLGSAEMVISNIGTITLALPPCAPSNSSCHLSAVGSSAAHQVRLLSLSNTISRLLTGPTADFISPVASYLPSGALVLPRTHRVSRVAFLFGSSLLMACTYLWTTLITQSQQGLWVLSLGTGIAYGCVFTVLPSLVSAIWGLKSLARNFGMLTYAPFLGTPLFSYLYALISSTNTKTKDDEGYSKGACEGKQCWAITFSVCACGSLLAMCVSALLWRRWRGRV